MAQVCRSAILIENTTLYVHLYIVHSIIFSYVSIMFIGGRQGRYPDRRKVTSVVEHSSTNPKIPNSGPGLIPGSWIMMRHVSCILLLEWSTTSQRLCVYRIYVPYAQKGPRFLFKKRRGQPREFWSLILTIDSSTLPEDCVEELQCGRKSNW